MSRLFIYQSVQGLKDLMRAMIYLLLIDYLKSANAKKLLVIHWSSINYYGSTKKYFLSLLMLMNSAINLESLITFLLVFAYFIYYGSCYGFLII
jgi:hypothetical protein